MPSHLQVFLAKIANPSANGAQSLQPIHGNAALNGVMRSTVETLIKEPTFLGNSLLKDLIFCLYNSYIRDGGSASTVETRIK